MIISNTWTDEEHTEDETSEAITAGITLNVTTENEENYQSKASYRSCYVATYFTPQA